MDPKPITSTLPPHVLIFPLPIQGHVNSMLKIAELLSDSGIHVTFLVSDHSHDRLLRYSSVHRRFSCYPGFRFATISDGLSVGNKLDATSFQNV
ncbi:hypothetical protein LguiB_029444 [Lonicera macranthoides]